MTERCKNAEDAKVHTGDILRVAATKDSRGLPSGPDTVVAAGILFAMRPLRGREVEIARQLFAGASVMVTLHLSRSWGLTPHDKIVYRGGPLDGRILEIEHIADEGGLGLDTEIVCGEGDLS